MLSEKDWSEIYTLRKNLHQNPELSGFEAETTRTIKRFIESLEGFQMLDMGKSNGLIAVIKGENPGYNILFRADIDALPVAETTNLEYKSKVNGCMHACGHDGHTAILAALAKLFSYHTPKYGNVILVFQPAEENGSGAIEMADIIKRSGFVPDFGFALHNIPGFEKNTIIVKPNAFAVASKGMKLTLTGKTAHASYPETGISPVQAIGDLIGFYKNDIKNTTVFEDFVLVTIVHILAGEKTFGTAPGNAEIFATFRSYNDNDMQKLTQINQLIIDEIAQKYNLKTQIEFTDIFPALYNNLSNVKWIMEVAGKNGLEINVPVNPFRWSEDFSWYGQICPIAMFGIGSGINQPALHHPDFDFPDDIIETGVKMFYGLYQLITK